MVILWTDAVFNARGRASASHVQGNASTPDPIHDAMHRGGFFNASLVLRCACVHLLEQIFALLSEEHVIRYHYESFFRPALPPLGSSVLCCAPN